MGNVNTNTNTNQIINGVIWKQLLIFFFPIALGTLFQQLYNTVDAIIVGRFVGKAALASVGGSASVLSNMVIGFFTGLSAGAAVIISQFYGAGDSKNLNKSLHTAYAFSLIASVFVALIGCLLTPWMLRTMNTPAEIMTDSILYLRIYFVGTIAMLNYNMGSGIMRALGDSKRPLYFLIVCCFLNIGLDILFVVVFHLGIAGAAIATVISQAVSAIMVIRALMTAYDEIQLKLKELRIHLGLLKSELRLGIPGGIQFCMYSITNIIIQTAINGFGTDTAAAWGAFGKADMIFWTISGAFGTAITTFAGQNFGAKKIDRIHKSVRVCLGMDLGASAAIIGILMIFCKPLLHIFTSDANVVNIGTYMMRSILPSYIIFVVVEVMSGALRGMGDVMIPTLITMGGVCGVRVPWMLFVLPMRNELSTILISYPLAWIVTAALIIPYYLYRKKKPRTVFYDH